MMRRRTLCHAGPSPRPPPPPGLGGPRGPRAPPRHPPPAEVGVHRGLAFTLWLPERPPWGGLVVIHGAGSRKENHHDMARAARAAGMAAGALDPRGPGGTG